MVVKLETTEPFETCWLQYWGTAFIWSKSFQFALHFSRFHYSFNSSETVFVDKSVTSMETTGDHCNI